MHPQYTSCPMCGARMKAVSKTCRACYEKSRIAHVAEPNPSGICLCGCGQPTPLANRTRNDGTLTVKGKPVAYIKGHQRRVWKCIDCGKPVDHGSQRCVPCHLSHKREGMDMTPPNPSGLCLCGCGQKTAIATYSDRETGAVIGEHLRFVTGHNVRGEAYLEIMARPEYIVNTDTGCWEWQRHISDEYGRIGHRKAHQVFYRRFRGPIPRNRVLHHVCENKRCVNPDHLLPVTRSEHARLHKR
jgi:hypothetical protein